LTRLAEEEEVEEVEERNFICDCVRETIPEQLHHWHPRASKFMHSLFVDWKKRRQ
jgi:hypothetical protein